jgi:hypothetical protein
MREEDRMTESSKSEEEEGFFKGRQRNLREIFL